MTATACRLCGAAVSDATVCTGCGRRCELALGDTPALVADLETVLAKLTVYADQAQRVTGSKADEEIVPWNLTAGLAREHLRYVLLSWVRIVHQEEYHERTEPVAIGPTCERTCLHASCRDVRLPWRPLPADRITSCAAWLLHEVEWVRRQKWADEAIGNILDTIRAAEHVLDAPAGRTTDPLGACPVGDCPGEVRAYLPRDPDTMCHADCTVDPLHTWDSTMFLGLGKRMLRLEVA